MKNYLFITAALVAGLTLSSCGSSKETAYRKAYEKAKAQDVAQQPATQTPAVAEAPVVTTVQEPTPVTTQANVPVRQENVNLVQGTGLKDYSVIVGSFGVRANAEGLMSTLKGQGHDAQIAFNPQNNMYRVAIATFNTRDEAVKSKMSFVGTYPDAWLLLKK